jgi:hypothetical protein
MITLARKSGFALASQWLTPDCKDPKDLGGQMANAEPGQTDMPPIAASTEALSNIRVTFDWPDSDRLSRSALVVAAYVQSTGRGRLKTVNRCYP